GVVVDLVGLLEEAIGGGVVLAVELLPGAGEQVTALRLLAAARRRGRGAVAVRERGWFLRPLRAGRVRRKRRAGRPSRRDSAAVGGAPSARPASRGSEGWRVEQGSFPAGSPDRGS